MATLLGDTNLFGTIAGLANREDLIDLITLTDPFEHPFITMVNKGTASLTNHEWLTEGLTDGATATATGGSELGVTYAEGAAFSAAGLNARTRLGNLCQIFRKDVQVSNTQRSVSPAGVQDEYLHQVQLALKELGRDIEITLFQGAAASAVGDSGTLRTMKPLQTWISTNSFSTTSTAIGCTGVGFSGTSWSIGEVAFNGCLERAYRQGGRVDSVFVNGSAKRMISRFGVGTGPLSIGTGPASVTQRTISAAARTLVSSVDVYESDFGRVNIILDRWVGQVNGGDNQDPVQPNNKAFFLQMDAWELAFLRPLKHVPLPPGGDAVRGMILTELTLVAYNEKWSTMLSGVGTVVGGITADGTVGA